MLSEKKHARIAEILHRTEGGFTLFRHCLSNFSSVNQVWTAKSPFSQQGIVIQWDSQLALYIFKDTAEPYEYSGNIIEFMSFLLKLDYKVHLNEILDECESILDRFSITYPTQYPIRKDYHNFVFVQDELDLMRLN